MYKLGQYVKTINHNYRGRISKKHHIFNDTNHSDEWFMAQKPALPEEMISEKWYSILTHNGGSILVPESGIEKQILPFKLINNWEGYYFETQIQ